MSLRPNAIPDAEMLAKAGQVEIWDETGKKVTFGSVFEGQKTIVVFIRHFFCGSCQQYVAQLASYTTPETLEAANTKVIVIGCGEWKLIANYQDVTKCKTPMYADPSRALYHALGMNIENLKMAPAGEQKRSYLQQSVLVNAVGSALISLLQSIHLFIVGRALKTPSHIGKQGNVQQLGGEFIFGPGMECSFASRMQHTEDHVETLELLSHAGVEVQADTGFKSKTPVAHVKDRDALMKGSS